MKRWRRASPDQLPTLDAVLKRAHLFVAVTAITLAGTSLTLGGLLALGSIAEHNLQLIGRSLSYTVEAAVMFRDAEAAQELVELIASTEEVGAVTVSDQHGTVLASWQQPETGHLLANTERLVSHLLLPSSVTLPIYQEGTIIGQVKLSGSGRSLASFLLRGVVLIFACLLLSIGCALVLSRRTLKGIIRPLKYLAKVAHAVRYDRAFEKRVPQARIAELYELSADFNELLDELETWQARWREENASLSHQASHDSLTGLANRANFERRLDRSIRDAREHGYKVGVLYMDSNRFKEINDNLGHASGDAVLVALATRMQAQVRSEDMVARLGGDEFAVLIAPLHDPEDIETIADNIQASMKTPVILPDGRNQFTSLSIGIAVFPDHAENPKELLKRADVAMYRAKRSGGDSWSSAHTRDRDRESA